MERLNVIEPVAASLANTVTLATTQRAVGAVIVAILAIAGVVVFWFNTRKAEPELGSEIELAPNRKPYYDDEDLEGPVLDRVLGLALLLIGIIAVGLPIYWLAEPGRQEGAAIAYYGDPDDESDMGIFASRGEDLYIEQACGDCHGGVQGGVRSHILLDPDGNFQAEVQWKAPALDTVALRYDRSEIEYILNYGRPGTPMQAFGTPGGGPLTEQQIDNIIDYLFFIAIDEEEAKAAATAEIERSLEAGEYDSLGEAVFNLGLNSPNFAGGAYSCGRCHTPGWSYGNPGDEGGAGTIGFSLLGGSTINRFTSEADHYQFVFDGSEDGVGYGNRGQGTGKMPGFGRMLTEEQIQAVVEYERGL